MDNRQLRQSFHHSGFVVKQYTDSLDITLSHEHVHTITHATVTNDSDLATAGFTAKKWIDDNKSRITQEKEKEFATFAVEVQDAVNALALVNHLFYHLKNRSNLSLPLSCPQLRLTLHQLYYIAHDFKVEPESPFYDKDYKACDKLIGG